MNHFIQTARPSSKVIKKVEETIKRYRINNKFLVAYSGGKDSYFLCLVLKEIGIEFEPIILDIGYNIDWSRHIELLSRASIDVRIINTSFIRDFKNWNEENVINEYFSMVKDNVNKDLTPCTPCYNAKILMLQHIAKMKEVTECAFGHHGTDAVTSLLKSMFMYLDRFEKGNKSFNITRFYDLVDEYKPIFGVTVNEFIKSAFYKFIEDLIKNERIGTDEPIRQKCGNINIIRPMFEILEDEIKDEDVIKKLSFPKSECFIRGVRNGNFISPREYIQKVICLNKNTNKENLRLLLQLIKNNLKEDGSLKYDARRNRTTLLGSLYEQDLQSCVKL